MFCQTLSPITNQVLSYPTNTSVTINRELPCIRSDAYELAAR